MPKNHGRYSKSGGGRPNDSGVKPTAPVFCRICRVFVYPPCQACRTRAAIAAGSVRRRPDGPPEDITYRLSEDDEERRIEAHHLAVLANLFVLPNVLDPSGRSKKRLE